MAKMSEIDMSFHTVFNAEGIKGQFGFGYQ